MVWFGFQVDFGSLVQHPSCSSPFPSLKSMSLCFVSKKTTEDPLIPPWHWLIANAQRMRIEVFEGTCQDWTTNSALPCSSFVRSFVRSFKHCFSMKELSGGWGKDSSSNRTVREKEIFRVPLFRRLIFADVHLRRSGSRWIFNCWWRANTYHSRCSLPWRNPMINASIPCEKSTESTLPHRETPEEKERRILDNNRHIVSLIRRLRKEMFKHAETLR